MLTMKTSERTHLDIKIKSRVTIVEFIDKLTNNNYHFQIDTVKGLYKIKKNGKPFSEGQLLEQASDTVLMELIGLKYLA